MVFLVVIRGASQHTAGGLKDTRSKRNQVDSHLQKVTFSNLFKISIVIRVRCPNIGSRYLNECIDETLKF